MLYDCFTFFNELDLLEIRLHELDPVVDRFVLVEAEIDHTGHEKPLYYEENKEQFKEFNDKIIHIVAPKTEMPGPSAMEREIQQRNLIRWGLHDLKEDDRVLVGDVDEIPLATSIPEEVSRYMAFHQPTYYFKVNWLGLPKWTGTVIASGDFIKHGHCEFKSGKIPWTPQLCRQLRKHKFLISPGGWHFTWLGDVDHFLMKAQAYSHHDILHRLTNGYDRIAAEQMIFNGDAVSPKPLKITKVKFDDTFPFYLRMNSERFAHLIDREV